MLHFSISVSYRLVLGITSYAVNNQHLYSALLQITRFSSDSPGNERVAAPDVTELLLSLIAIPLYIESLNPILATKNCKVLGELEEKELKCPHLLEGALIYSLII